MRSKTRKKGRPLGSKNPNSFGENKVVFKCSPEHVRRFHALGGAPAGRLMIDMIWEMHEVRQAGGDWKKGLSDYLENLAKNDAPK